MSGALVGCALFTCAVMFGAAFAWVISKAGPTEWDLFRRKP